MITDIQAGVLSAVVVYIILNTNAVFEYLDFLFKFQIIKDFKKFNESNKFFFLDYLHTRYANFFTNLLTCPICLGTWLGFCFNFFGKLVFGGKIDLGFGVSIFISWVLYFILIRLANEPNNKK
jgi:hypothetical protein